MLNRNPELLTNKKSDSMRQGEQKENLPPSYGKVDPSSERLLKLIIATKAGVLTITLWVMTMSSR